MGGDFDVHGRLERLGSGGVEAEDEGASSLFFLERYFLAPVGSSSFENLSLDNFFQIGIVVFPPFSKDRRVKFTFAAYNRSSFANFSY